MINVKEFVYSKLHENATLTGLVGDRIFPQRMPQNAKTWPVVIYSRISPGKLDSKGIRNEYFQVSVWGQKVSENESIMGVIASIFHNLKVAPVKHCDVQRIDETFDPETQTFGNHVTVHIKLFEQSL